MRLASVLNSSTVVLISLTLREELNLLAAAKRFLAKSCYDEGLKFISGGALH